MFEKSSMSLHVQQNMVCFGFVVLVFFLKRTTQNLAAAHAKMQKAVARMTAF